MCGRFANATSPDGLKTAFKVRFPREMGHNRPPRWNVAPGTEIETIVDDGASGRRVAPARWGMGSPGSGRLLINAKGETMFGKPSFAEAARHGRCLVVATGWYEWKGPRQPYFIRRRDGAPMGIGGIFRQVGRDRHAVVVTRPADGDLLGIHHRAPLLLAGPGLEQWLEPSSPRSVIEGLVRAGDGEGLESYPVPAAVGSVKEDHEGLAERDDNHGKPPSAQMELL